MKQVLPNAINLSDPLQVPPDKCRSLPEGDRAVSRQNPPHEFALDLRALAGRPGGHHPRRRLQQRERRLVRDGHSIQGRHE